MSRQIKFDPPLKFPPYVGRITPTNSPLRGLKTALERDFQTEIWIKVGRRSQATAKEANGQTEGS